MRAAQHRVQVQTVQVVHHALLMHASEIIALAARLAAISPLVAHAKDKVAKIAPSSEVLTALHAMVQAALNATQENSN